MKIFSGLKFFSENKKKSFVFFVVIALAICVVTIITILINMLIETVENYNVKPYSYFSVVLPNDGSEISQDVIKECSDNEAIDNVMEISYDESLVKLVVGGYSRVPIFFMDSENTERLMEYMGTSVKEGRLPKEGEKEIALDWRLMKNKELKVGDKVGNLIESGEVLYGEYTVVGSLNGDTMVSIGGTTYSKSASKKGLLLLHTKKKIDAAEKFVNKEFDESLYVVTTHESQKDFVDESLNSLKGILVAIISAVAVILSISIGAFMYIIYVQRAEEFGIMVAIGYNRNFVRNLILKEVTMLNFLSWLVGIILAAVIVGILNVAIYVPQGAYMNPFSVNVLFNTLIIPIVSTVMSIIPLMRYLKRTDPISVIERR